MFDFDRYFLKECQVFLSHIEYDILSLPKPGENKLTVRDSISSYDTAPDKVKVELSRSLDFGVGSVFDLRVVFGITLTKNPFSINEVDWSQVNVVEELKRSKAPLINNIMSRVSVLIAQITSIAGQVPIVTPPQLIKAPQ